MYTGSSLRSKVSSRPHDSVAETIATDSELDSERLMQVQPDPYPKIRSDRISLTKKYIRLYALGSNGAGQLGIGHVEDVDEPQQCRFVGSSIDTETDESYSSELEVKMFSELSPRIKIVAGGSHTLLLLSDIYGRRRLFSAGNNTDGRCGAVPTNASQNKSFVFTEYSKSDNKIRYAEHIAASWEASFFADSLYVYSSGTGNKGELGLGEKVISVSRPRKVLELRNFLDSRVLPFDSICGIVASLNHVVVWTLQGCVIGWGASRKGQLGAELKDAGVVWMPKVLAKTWNFEVRSVVVGKGFTLLRGSSNNELALLGDTKHFQLPLPPLSSHRHEVKSGWSSVTTRSKTGCLSGYGSNNLGQLPPPGLPPVKDFAVGSEHSIALLQEDRMAAWGWGEHGNCGKPTRENGVVSGRWNEISVPTSTDANAKLRVGGMAAGCATSFFWTFSDAGEDELQCDAEAATGPSTLGEDDSNIE